MRTLALAAIFSFATLGVVAADPLPEHLDRDMISNGIASVQPAADACNLQPRAKGVVKVSVTVDKTGKVTESVIKETPNKALGACVARVMSTIKFPVTQQGGSFAYPFVY